MSNRKSKELCKGCRNDFYNGRQNFTGNECWSFKDAKVCRRWKLHWWTEPTVAGAFTEVVTLDCHHQPGQFAFYKELPTFALSPRRLTA